MNLKLFNSSPLEVGEINLKKKFDLSDDEIVELDRCLMLESMNLEDLICLFDKEILTSENTLALGLWNIFSKNNPDISVFNLLKKRLGFKDIEDVYSESSIFISIREYIWGCDSIEDAIERRIKWKKNIIVFLPNDLFSYYNKKDHIGITASEVYRILECTKIINGNVYFVRGVYD
ncbi:MAG: hypothetical protein ACMG57_02620 [Candidatus Dojkabacteria bacterium]